MEKGYQASRRFEGSHTHGPLFEKVGKKGKEMIHVDHPKCGGDQGRRDRFSRPKLPPREMKDWPSLKPYTGLPYKNKQSKEEDKDV